MEEKQNLQHELQELEDTRVQTVDQIARAHGTLRADLEKVLVGIDAEIAELKRRLAHS